MKTSGSSGRTPPTRRCTSSKVGRFWSARVGIRHRVLAVEDGSDVVWFWIGRHDEYRQLIDRGR